MAGQVFLTSVGFGLHNQTADALANGDIPTALDNNLLFVILVPLLVAGWILWMVRAWCQRGRVRCCAM